MKKYYQLLMAYLKAEITTLSWIDEEKNQLDSNYSFGTPAIIVDIETGEWKTEGDNTQVADAVITIKTIQANIGDTQQGAADGQGGLTTFDLDDLVHEALQGWAFYTGANPNVQLSTSMMRKSGPKKDKSIAEWQVHTLTYICQLRDKTATPAYKYVTVTDVDVEGDESETDFENETFTDQTDDKANY